MKKTGHLPLHPEEAGAPFHLHHYLINTHHTNAANPS